MDLNKPEYSDIEHEQILHWLKQPKVSATYQEPQLQEFTVEVIKLICDVLEQTDEVFITSVDVLEKYVHLKNLQTMHNNNCNSLLVMACCILLSSKLIGSGHEIKIAAIQRLIVRLSKEKVAKTAIEETELDILLTIGELPLTTVISDLTMFLEYYIKPLKLKIDIQPLCLEILNVVYISRKQLFADIRSIYIQNADAFEAFKNLACNKFYLPCGIVLSALNITKFKNTLNMTQITKEIEKISHIHCDHLQLLTNAIFQCVSD